MLGFSNAQSSSTSILGIWDVLNNQQVVSFIRREINHENDLRTAIESLMDHCLAPNADHGGIGCDNMTVVIIAFLNGRSSQDWYDWIAERYETKVGPEYIEKEDTPSEQGNADEDYSLYDNDYNDDLTIGDVPNYDEEIP